MLIKEADDQSHVFAELERLSAGGKGLDAKRAKEALVRRKAGLKGEAESTYLINFEFAKSANWAVLHDLRLEHGGRTAQIDHLLINRWMEFFVLETKQFHAGVKITDDGEFLRWNAYRKNYDGMASPLEQNERHIAVLADVLDDIELPSRLGMRIPPSFRSLVLVGSQARIMRPKGFDASRVIKPDQLKSHIWREFDAENPLSLLLRSAAKLVSGETIEFVARQLAARHTPLAHNGTAATQAAPATQTRGTVLPGGRIEPVFTEAKAPPRPSHDNNSASGVQTTRTSCKGCQKTTGNILYGKYGYYFKCDACGVNTAVRFTCKPGHTPRVRKDGDNFYRDCKSCSTSTFFHQNRSAT